MKLGKTIAVTLLMSALIIGFSACDSDGPLEEAGEEVDDSVEDAGDAVEDAGDSVEDAVDGN